MQRNTLIQVTQHGMGTGSEELGLKLITNYFKLLDADGRTPKIIVFYNAGVKLICENSPALEALQNLSKKGVQLVACKTCLDHFSLTDKMKVGIVGSMPDIITLQADADKVINL
ncbi:hypothetical protein BZG02_17690 [Labilibaculum filiforme]|uniref:Uncharacterized protein n=1 Tax=Labilibaculum filiforme TaxID=1940526 RepID=A0A2N3HRZ7_9BACT|nr:sulfurtransferase-like selenium metabolism protein YedF [Labilibaculum filiforme]PKQ60836.1 hypothetical protein BZG02_17690 [Labilibaculum filiforme]